MVEMRKVCERCESALSDDGPAVRDCCWFV